MLFCRQSIDFNYILLKKLKLSVHSDKYNNWIKLFNFFNISFCPLKKAQSDKIK